VSNVRGRTLIRQHKSPSLKVLTARKQSDRR